MCGGRRVQQELGGWQGFSVCADYFCDVCCCCWRFACALIAGIGQNVHAWACVGGEVCAVGVWRNVCVPGEFVEPVEAPRFGVVSGIGRFVAGYRVVDHALRLSSLGRGKPFESFSCPGFTCPGFTCPGRPRFSNSLRSWPGALGIQKPGSALAGETLFLCRFIPAPGRPRYPDAVETAP